jgi:DNA-binding XRE family transcriptional regulator
MNATSRAILQTVLSADASLSAAERSAAQRLISGQSEAPTVDVGHSDERLLVTQKQAAEMLGVSRVTIWRITKDCVLHPVEILPGTWRYPYHEILALARRGIAAESIASGGRGQSAA